jgi:opacity protein-like surface antigen
MRKILIATLLLTLPVLVNAQNWKFFRNEIFFGIGASNFLGELGGADQIGTNGIKDLEFSMTRPALQAGYRFKASRYFGIRANLSYARLNGDDATTSEEARFYRNLSFKSPLIEFSAILEYFPFSEKMGHLYRLKGAKGSKNGYFSPYVFGGIGGIWFNPKAELDGTWHALQPLGTEGQYVPGSGKEPYKKISLAVPVGVGVKYALNRQWSISFEVGMRKTFTDYIDDVSGNYWHNAEIQQHSGNVAAALADRNPNPANGFTGVLIGQDGIENFTQRGDPSDNDAYMFAIFSIHYKLLKGRINLPKL